MSSTEKKTGASRKGKNLGDVQEMNRSLVLRLLKKAGVSSRATIAKLSGLNTATITNIIGEFLKWGIVMETGLIDGEKGRRSIGIQINQKEYYVVGIRLQRRIFKIGLFDIFGELITKRVFSHETLDPFAVTEKVKQETHKLLQENADKRILGIGVAVPGPYFQYEGRIRSITDFEGWDNVAFLDTMTGDFDIPVIIDHDANAGAMAEWWVSPNTLTQGTSVYFSVDEGVGAGIINDGRIFRGALGTAGEVGHMSIDINGEVCACGNRGCLVNCGSVHAMMRAAEREMPKYPGTVLKPGFTYEALFEAVRSGDGLADFAFRATAKNLAAGIINMICAYGANEIIIGHTISEIGEYLIETLHEYMKGHTFAPFLEKVCIRLTSFDEDAIFIGAAALAIDYCLGKTKVFENKDNCV